MTSQDSINESRKQISGNNKEVRKIQFTGRSTYQLSLPKKWIKEMNLKPGDSVTIVRQFNNSLCIMPNILRDIGENYEAMISIGAYESNSSLARKLISVYLQGYNIIHVRCRERLTQRHKDAVKSILKHLVGAEMMSDSTNHFTVQVMMSLTPVTMSSIVRRMMVITSSMFRNVLHAAMNSDWQLAKLVSSTDDEIDRFSFYILRNVSLAISSERVLREIGFESAMDALFYRSVARSMEEIADNVCEIAKVLLTNDELDEKARKDMADHGNTVLILFETAIEAFLRKNYESTDAVIEKLEQIKNSIQLHHDNELALGLHAIVRHIKEIAEISLDQSVANISRL
ncbi:MAG: phosphate uptake regulator PhoU [Nitrososphaerales archaeon]